MAYAEDLLEIESFEVGEGVDGDMEEGGEAGGIAGFAVSFPEREDGT